MRALIVIGALLWSGAVFGDLPTGEADGWYRWVIDNDEQTVMNVRLKNGELAGMRIHNHYINCYPGREVNATDLGVITAEENFRWFRNFVEDTSADRSTRESALIGIVQTGTDEAFEYVETLLELS